MIEKAKEDQYKFKSNLNEIKRANPSNKVKDQLNGIENIKNLNESREEIIKLYSD